VRIHVVRQGECLSSIAAAYGFADWRRIYNDAANAALREKRPNPGLLHPGDEVAIPDLRTRTVSLPTGNVHRIVVKRPRRELKLRMLDEHGLPMRQETFIAEGRGLLVSGQTDAEGILTVELDTETTSIEIWIAGETRVLTPGTLNPIAETPDRGVSGVQGRLIGLGFHPGPIDGTLGPRTRAALVAFQRRCGLQPTGLADAETVARLEQEYQA
jgi:N-acetylmuramoyl-L-alanine amidase